MSYNNARMTRQRLAYDPNRDLDPNYVKNMMSANSDSSTANSLASILGDQQGQNRPTTQQQLSKTIMDLPYNEQQGQANVKGLRLDTSALETAQREYGIEPSTSAQSAPKNSGTGLGTEDWVGMGLQAYGAMRADKETEAERKRQEAKDEQAMQRQGITDRQNAQMAERQMQQQDRSQDMTGLNYLAQQRANAMQNRTAYSFRNNFAKALRG